MLLPDQDSNLDQPVNSRTLCRLSYRGLADEQMLVRLHRHVTPHYLLKAEWAAIGREHRQRAAS